MMMEEKELQRCNQTIHFLFHLLPDTVIPHYYYACDKVYSPSLIQGLFNIHTRGN